MAFDPKKLMETPIEGASETERRPEDSVDFTPQVEQMIFELQALNTHSNFLESVYEWGLEKGWLTNGQMTKLEELYDER